MSMFAIKEELQNFIQKQTWMSSYHVKLRVVVVHSERPRAGKTLGVEF